MALNLQTFWNENENHRNCQKNPNPLKILFFHFWYFRRFLELFKAVLTQWALDRITFDLVLIVNITLIIYEMISSPRTTDTQ